MLIDYVIFFFSLCLIFFTAFYYSKGLWFKICSLLSIMLGSALLVSSVLNFVPGDPVDHIVGELAVEKSRQAIALKLGLVDENHNPLSIVSQYSRFLVNLSQNQLRSFIHDEPALKLIISRLPYTAALAFLSIIFAIILGPLMGMTAAFFKNKFPDSLVSFIALLGISTPSFFLGPLLLILFSIKLNLLPVSGADDGILSLILPSLSLGFAFSAMLARMARSTMIEVLSQDYIRTAKAKGLSTTRVFFIHGLRNILIPIITLAGLQLGVVLTGTVIIEKIFNWPGIGLLLFESIQKLDLPVVQTCVLFIAFVFALINMLTDEAYKVIDPRFRTKGLNNE